MDEEVRPGFLPPKPPAGAAAPPRFQPPAPVADRPTFVTQRMEAGPRSPLALAGTIVGSIALVLLLLTIGVGFFVSGVLALVSIMFGLLARQQIQQAGVGRAGQARAAIWIGSIALGLSIVAFVVWTALDASGFTPEDLQRWLEDRLEEQRNRTTAPREDVQA